MKKTYLKNFGMCALVAVPMMIGTAAVAGEYQPGDFHQHTLYTDGSHPFMTMMAENNNYLQWWANSEHGGARPTDGEGVKWKDTSKYPVNPILGDNPDAGNMYRWQSLRDYVYPQILDTRGLYKDKVIISGLEQNVPGHEHCSIAIHQYDNTATAISEFEYRFDKSDHDTSRNGELSLLSTPELGSVLSKTNITKDDAILGVKWMQAMKDAGIGDAWIVPAHVERAWSYTIEDFRNWMDAGPDVAFGFEGQPGHQTSGDRGFGRGSLGGGTFGGTGFFVAKVGGLWDALSAEGRLFFNFASSDSHEHWSVGGGDFWPGEYQKIYTYIDTEAADPIQAAFDGNRSGNVWNVEGDLIDELEFTAKAKKETAMMGQILKVKAGEQVQIKIKVHDPNTKNNCPLDMDNPSLAQVDISQPLSMPVLDHIDLIGGTITGNVVSTNQNDPVATDYQTDTKVIKTFGRNGGVDKNGYMTYVLNIKPENSMFLRLRGTNLPPNIPNETDAEGNPLEDYLVSDALYSPMDPAELEAKLFPGVEITTNSKLDEVAEAYADLWFYSNPIYIEVE
jgi:hypothetical protein